MNSTIAKALGIHLRHIKHITTLKTLGSQPPDVWATSIIVHRNKVLEVEFNNGDRFAYPAEYLRVESPAAEPVLASGKPRVTHGRRHVGILGVEPVGSYAVRLCFDDLHSSGIYTWPYLHALGAHKRSRMRRYIRMLRESGLSRDPTAARPTAAARTTTAAASQC